MAATRTRNLQVNIEPTVHEAVAELCEKLSMSASSYIRRLIIRDLRDRGIFTDEMIADIALAS